MTVGDAMLEAMKRTKRLPGTGLIPDDKIPMLVDEISGSKWSTSVIISGKEHQMIQFLCRFLRHENVTDDMCKESDKWLIVGTQPSLNSQ